MLHLFAACLIVSSSIVLTLQGFDELHLITQYYNAKNLTRSEEHDYAFCMNVANPFISTIHLLQAPQTMTLDAFTKDLVNVCRPEWNVPTEAFKKLNFVNDDPSISVNLKFSEAVAYALKRLSKKLVMISDADIYYDDSLRLLVKNAYVFYELVMLKRNYYLSRYARFAGAGLGTQCGPKFRELHDAFIFSPSPSYNFLPAKANFALGTWGLANRVIYELQQQGILDFKWLSHHHHHHHAFFL